MNPVLALLAKELGQTLGRRLFHKLNQRASRSKLAQAEELIASGATVISALRSAFGSGFADALRSVVSPPTDWTYEAGTAHYVRLKVTEMDDAQAVDVLQDELNINLDRIAAKGTIDESRVRSYVRGVFTVWLSRFEQTIGLPNARARAAAARLRSNVKGVESIRSKLARLSGLATLAAGLMMIAKAGMLFFSIGVGVFALLKFAFFGVPFLLIAGLVVGGMSLAGIGIGLTSPVKSCEASTAAADAAYALLNAARMQSRD
jgi:hypothetical protein